MNPPRDRGRRGPSCDEVRRAVHDQFDAPVGATMFRALARHLAGCADCRAHQREMRQVFAGLRALPRLRLPEEALEEVWRRTARSRRPDARAWVRRRASVGMGLAAAAAIGLAVARSLLLRGSLPAVEAPRASVVAAGELEQALGEVKLALGIASEALRRCEEAAVSGLAGSDLLPVLERVPILRIIGDRF
jgi:predicted anti-sigma-YlaC factor YlaD